MIQTGNIHELSGLHTAPGRRDILFGWRHIAARMIVQQQESGCIRQDSGLQNIGDGCNRTVDAAHADDVEIDGLQLVVEVHYA